MRLSRRSIPVGWGNASKVAPLPPPRIAVTAPKLFIPTAFAGPRRIPPTVQKFECREDEKTCRANGREPVSTPGSSPRACFAGKRSRSAIEKRVSSTRWHRKFVRHGQRATLVGFQRNFLRQHDISGDKVTFGRKAPTKTRTAGAVELVDVHRIAVANPVSFSAMAAGDLKIASRFILRELLRSEDGLVRSGCCRNLSRRTRARRRHSDRNSRRRSFALRNSCLNMAEVSRRRAVEKTASLRH